MNQSVSQSVNKLWSRVTCWRYINESIIIIIIIIINTLLHCYAHIMGMGGGALSDGDVSFVCLSVDRHLTCIRQRTPAVSREGSSIHLFYLITVQLYNGE